MLAAGTAVAAADESDEDGVSVGETGTSGPSTDGARTQDPLRTRPPRVVMMVANDIRHDTRVLKEGLALADGGAEVTLLGLSSSGHRQDAMLGSIRVLRVPAATRVRDAMVWRRGNRRHVRWTTPPRVRRARELQSRLRSQEAQAAQTLSARLRHRLYRVRLGAAAVGSKLAERSSRWQTNAWERFDDRVSERTLGASWRRLLPEIDDYALALGPVLDDLDWDVLHAHDVHLVGVAAGAVARKRRAGHRVHWVYDAHELVAGLSLYGGRTARRRAAYLSLEAEFVRRADAVLTVTDALADDLTARYRLPSRPAVVMNSPDLDASSWEIERTLRDDLGLAPDVPLVVYSGGVTLARGVETAVEALTELPDVHLAVIAVPHTRIRTVTALAALAEEAGVADRLHLLDPVPPDKVSAYVASADVGIIPILHFGSHEVALANKLFEYLFAGLPVLVSNCRAQAEFVRRHRVGGVHVAGSAASFATELRDLLARRQDVVAAIRSRPELLTDHAWGRQATVLRDLYRSLLGDGTLHEPTAPTALEQLVEVPRSRRDRPSVIGIGPANMAGQAWEWAKAVEREVPGASTYVLTVDRGSPLTYPCDELVPAETFAKDQAWAQRLEATAVGGWTHALLEAGRPVLGRRHGADFTGDARVLGANGIEVALVLHGSEIRDPALNARRTPWSPFTDPRDPLTARLAAGRDRLAPLVEDFAGPCFVSTPDLLADVPGAVWLPVVVDVDRWASSRPVLERERPVVLHAPSRASLKGSDRVEEAVRPLVAEGLVEYRRLEGVRPEQMPDAVADADIVLDQFALGIYGVMAAEAMAAGRLVVSHVMAQVRELCPLELPVVEAPPDRLTEVLRQVLRDRDEARATAARGPQYVREVHDGRRSARVLTEHLGLSGTQNR